jgi:hypothetical protein
MSPTNARIERVMAVLRKWGNDVFPQIHDTPQFPRRPIFG